MNEETPVRFRVVDEHGLPVEGAFISMLRSTVAFPEISLVTDQDGMVQLFLPAGKFMIGADAPGKCHNEVEFAKGMDSAGSGDVLVTLQNQK